MEIHKLNRFTTLPVLLDLLQRKKLVLLDPDKWDDRNDAEILLEYKRRMGLGKLFALCFSHGDETVHHWKTFSDGSSGCCIEFDARKLGCIFERTRNLRYGKVEYRKLSEVEREPIRTERIPFVKRWPYRCEDEFRIIWEGEHEGDCFEIDIPIDSINRITISQRMPQRIFDSIKEYLMDGFADPESRISRSTLYQNKRWINSFKNSETSAARV